MTPLIEVKRLTKKYGKVTANDNISLTVNAGEIGVLLGPNGAGKSTLIKCVCGLLRYEGEALIDGLDNRTIEAKRAVGYVPEFPAPYPMLTVYEHLEFIARAYKLKDWGDRAEQLMRRFDLIDKRDKLGKELSKGMQQKVSVCCALLPEPKAVILDEPLVGLDPHGIRELNAAVADLKSEGRAVLVSTHIIDSVEKNWDATYIMDGGRVVRECRRGDTDGNLEDIYFSIIKQDTPQDESGAAL